LFDPWTHGRCNERLPRGMFFLHVVAVWVFDESAIEELLVVEGTPLFFTLSNIKKLLSEVKKLWPKI